MSEMNLYSHNKIAYEKVRKMFETENRVCIVHATGTGKSYIAYELIYNFLKENKDKNVIFLAPTAGIIEKLEEDLRSMDVDQEVLQNLSFRTYQSLIHLSKEELQNLDVDLLVTDEFHRLGAKEWKTRINVITKSHPNLKIFGMSATPVRGRAIGRAENIANTFFNGNIASTYDLSDAIVDGVLEAPNYHAAITEIKSECNHLEKRMETEGITIEEREDYQRKLNVIKSRLLSFDSIQEILRKNISKTGKYIYFCPSGSNMQKLGERLMKILDVKNAEFYYVKSDEKTQKENREQRKAFEENNDNTRLRIMFTIDMYNEGIHVKNLDGVIFGRTTSSDIIFFQQLGRALATKQRQKPLVIDLVNNFKNMALLQRKVLKKSEERKDETSSTLDLNFQIDESIIDFLTEFENIQNELNKLLNDAEKKEEFYLRISKEPFQMVTKDKFTDGTSMLSWFKKNKKEIYFASDDLSKKIVKTIEKYDLTVFLEFKTTLTFKERCRQYLEELQNLTDVDYKENGTFSDGKPMNTWFIRNRERILNSDLEECDKIRKQIQCKIMQNQADTQKAKEEKSQKLSFSQRCKETADLIEGELQGKSLPYEWSRYKFSNGTLISPWLKEHRKEIYLNKDRHEAARRLYELCINIDRYYFYDIKIEKIQRSLSKKL